MLNTLVIKKAIKMRNTNLVITASDVRITEPIRISHSLEKQAE